MDSRLAALAVLACLVSISSSTTGPFTNPVAQVYNTWDFSKGIRYIDNFDHFALERPDLKEVHEEEHTRQKRNAAQRQILAALPITKACERPGYTGQYCEFPICFNENPFVNPDQWNTETGFYIDVRWLQNCTQPHTLYIDDTLRGEIRIEIEASSPVVPQFILSDYNGNVFEPTTKRTTPAVYEATFRDLAPGVYLVSPSAQRDNGHCLVLASAATPLTISGGFIQDERERSDYPFLTAQAHAFNSIVLHGNQLASPGELKSIIVVGPENFMVRPRLLEKRFGCSYEYYFDSFFCYAAGSYNLIVEGVDHAGNIFRRTAAFNCESAPPQSTASPISTASTTAPNITTCYNNGVRLTRPDGTSYCVCSGQWAGVDCSTPICVNGGTSIMNECTCPIGFGGQHCEEVSCFSEVAKDFNVDQPTLILVLRIRQQMNDVIGQVRDAVNDYWTSLQAVDPDYFTRFHLVFFNNDKILLTAPYNNIGGVIEQLNKAANSGHTEGNCTDTVFASFLTGLQDLTTTAKSQIYVITDALADDWLENGVTIFQRNSYWKATPNFIFVDPLANASCDVDLDDPMFRAMEMVSNRFGGLTVHADRGQVYDILYQQLDTTFFRTQLMLSVDRPQCNAGLYKTVQVTRNDEQLIIVARGRQFHPFIQDPSGDYVDFEQVIDGHGYFGIWRLKNPLMGQYVIHPVVTPATAACSYRVYQGAYKARSTVRAASDLFWGIAPDIDRDGYFTQPYFMEENHPVFHLTNFPEFASQDRIFSALNIYAVRDGQEIEVYAANGLWRNRCSYQFYFPAYRCPIPSEELHFEFYARDDLGFYIQRGGVMTCTNDRPTPAPPTRCQNGGVMGTNNTCLCLPHYYGDFCQQIICENGGSQTGAACACGPGFTGMYCEWPRCDSPGPLPTFGYRVDMVFIVELTQRGSAQMLAVNDALPEILRDVVLQNGDWIERFVLAGYNESYSGVLVDAPANSPAKFLSTFNDIAKSTFTNNPCVMQTWEALRAVLRTRIFGFDPRGLPRRSVINLFETGIPDTFDGRALAREISQELLERNVIMNIFQARDTSGTNPNGPWFCNAKETDFLTLDLAANRGDGKMYTVTNDVLPGALFTAPTLFSSSIVYKYHQDDCTGGARVHFPLDAYTQTVSAIISGRNSTVNMMRFDGVQFSDEGRINLFDDGHSKVVEFRNPCDGGWDPVIFYCIHFFPSLSGKNFADTTAYCNSMNSFIVDDQSDIKNNYLLTMMAGQKPWLGLQLINGKWQFQHDNNTYTTPSVSYWGPAGAPTDTSKPCAYFDATATDGSYWKADACTVNHAVVCQKHRFETNNVPSRIGDDDISPGKYYFDVKTTPPTDTDYKGCSVSVRVQSDLQLEYGFVDNIHNDAPTYVMNIDAVDNRVVATASLGRSVSSMTVLKHVMLRSANSSSLLLEAATFGPRAGCNYGYVSQQLSCQQIGDEYTDFELVTVGEDASGNTFQRYTSSFCAKWIDECRNGGVYSQGKCVCPDYFTGYFCEFPQCVNGGTPSQDGTQCLCPDGFGGFACQNVQCASRSSDRLSNNNKSLVIIIELSTTTQSAAQNLATNLVNIVNTANAANPGWITNFFVHLFNSNGAMDDVKQFTSASDAASYITTQATTVTDAGGCNLIIYKVLNDAFKYVDYLDGSQILLVTAAQPLQNDQDQMYLMMEQFGTHQPRVDYIFVETPVCPITNWNVTVADFGNFIMSTGGTIFRTTPDNIASNLVSFLPSRYAAQRMSFTSPLGCNQEQIRIQVDVNMTNIWTAVGGDSSTIVIFDPKGDIMDTPAPVLRTNQQSFWAWNPSFPGLYTVQVTSTFPVCFPIVWGSGGVQVVTGFIQDLASSDAPLPFAVFGRTNYPVFALVDPDDSGFIRGRLYRSNMFRHTRNGFTPRPYKSDINPRSQCTYHYIGDPFECAENEEAITITAYGVDTFRQGFARMTTSWCKTFNGTLPTNPPITTVSTTPVNTPSSTSPASTSTSLSTSSPATTTTSRPLTPKDIQFDIIFMVDETENDQFQDIVAKPFIDNFMKIYSTSQAYARVGIITLPDCADCSMPLVFLSAVNSYDALVNNMDQLVDFVEYGPQEYLSTSLKYAHEQYKLSSNGYRPYIKNHLIVFITETTTFEPNDFNKAKTQISNIVSDASYGLVSIVYGPASTQPLTDLLHTPDCIFSAPDNATLFGDITTKLQSMVWRAFNETNGAYCHPQ